MSSFESSNIEYGRSISRPPKFTGTNFMYWKQLMKIFIKSQDLELWEIVQTGPHVFTKTTEDGKVVLKEFSEMSKTEIEKTKKNNTATHLLYCALTLNAYNMIAGCDNAKQVWDTLVMIYEGTSQVREYKANLLIHQYEMFMMKSGESINDMLTRFTHITNNLKSLGKTYTNEEIVQKILRSLHMAKWGPKVAAIGKTQDLKKLELGNLLGQLLTHEMTLHLTEEPLEKNNIALNKFKKDYNQNGREKNQKFNTSKSKSYNSKTPLSTNLSCFNCGSIEHFIKDCPKSKRKYVKRIKKTMVAAWFDSESDYEP